MYDLQRCTGKALRGGRRGERAEVEAEESGVERLRLAHSKALPRLPRRRAGRTALHLKRCAARLPCALPLIKRVFSFRLALLSPALSASSSAQLPAPLPVLLAARLLPPLSSSRSLCSSSVCAFTALTALLALLARRSRASLPKDNTARIAARPFSSARRSTSSKARVAPDASPPTASSSSVDHQATKTLVR